MYFYIQYITKSSPKHTSRYIEADRPFQVELEKARQTAAWALLCLGQEPEAARS